jgi:hypothetical protein
MSSANITQANLVSLNNPIVLNASITDLSGGPISDNVT